nr:hypothetical protein [candidate division Zixibacteria bacterium]
MRKMVDFYMIPGDPGCEDIQEFLEKNEILLRIRDIKKEPLTYDKISRLVRHLNLDHFINKSSKTYLRKGLDKNLPSRAEVIDLIARDNELMKFPITVAGRLMVIGPNLGKIKEMLQIKSNGSDPLNGDMVPRFQSNGRARAKE